MFQINLRSQQSIYEQIIDNIKELIIRGVLPEDSELPSIRELSRTLTVNPNTVQKAFSELERDGLIYSKPGSGWYVGEEKSAADDKLKKLLREKTVQFLKEMKTLGMNKQQIIRLLEEETDE